MRPHASTGPLEFSQGISDLPNSEGLSNEVASPAQPDDLLARYALTIYRAPANHAPIARVKQST